jgi:regulation of enolase protein 1 (concanavalin A-like superfamily)
VVTDGHSDWSLALAPDWAAQCIVIRVSRSGNALTIRAKPPDYDDLQLIRVVPFEPERVALAGPYICAPTRAGLTVRFHSRRSGQRHRGLH